MNKQEVYRIYIPAIIKALAVEDEFEQFHLKDPSFYLDASEEKVTEILEYLDVTAGHDNFLDRVAYYFDAKSHGFPSVDGVPIEEYRAAIVEDILKYKKEYSID